MEAIQANTGPMTELLQAVGARIEEENLRGRGRLRPTIPLIDSERLFTEHHVCYVPARQGRLVVIGDLHGDKLALDSALTLAGYDARTNPGLPPEERVTLCFVGDYVDVGARSLETMLEALRLKKQDPENVILLAGNHERDRAFRESENVRKFSWIRWFFEDLEKLLGKEEGNRHYDEFHDLMLRLPVLAVFPNGTVVCHATPPSLADDPDYPRRFRCRYEPERGLLNFEKPLIVDQVHWSAFTKVKPGEKDPEEDRIISRSQFPRMDPENEQPCWWIGSKSYFGFMKSIGGKVFLRGHDRAAVPHHTLFGGTAITVITTDYRSPDHGYDRSEKIEGRYLELDLARTYDWLNPAGIVRPLS